MSQFIGVPIKTEDVCLECGSPKLKEELKEQSFPYGPASARTILTASFPVSTCQDCGYEFFDERGESARHAAVCRHLGVQTPNEIRDVRDAAGLSRAEFCKIGGFGIASLQRWESGEVVPNTSSDRLLYLLQYQENILRLRARVCASTDGTSEAPTSADSVHLVEQCDKGAPNPWKQCVRTRQYSVFPALEKRGELIRSQNAGESIRRRGCFLAPVA
jgi:putative zinc finger/helix-turn-helix YgiT family protein